MQNDLISRKPLVDMLQGVEDNIFAEATREVSPTKAFVAGVVQEIKNQVIDLPAVEAVPVVRCKDCVKFWEYTEEHKATVEKADGDCMIRCMAAPDDLQFCAVQKDDYCSMGKRKED